MPTRSPKGENIGKGVWHFPSEGRLTCRKHPGRDHSTGALFGIICRWDANTNDGVRSGRLACQLLKASPPVFGTPHPPQSGPIAPWTGQSNPSLSFGRRRDVCSVSPAVRSPSSPPGYPSVASNSLLPRPGSRKRRNAVVGDVSYACRFLLNPVSLGAYLVRIILSVQFVQTASARRPFQIPERTGRFVGDYVPDPQGEHQGQTRHGLFGAETLLRD